MSHMLRRRRYHALAVALMVALGLGIWLFLSAQTAPPGPVVSSASLEGVDFDSMKPYIKVSVLPADVQPKVSRQAAEQAALDEFPGTSVRDTVFARFAQSTFEGPAWIVSLNNGIWAPLGGGSGVADFFYAVVDAETGEFIMAGMGGASPVDAPQPLSAPSDPTQ